MVRVASHCWGGFRLPLSLHSAKEIPEGLCRSNPDGKMLRPLRIPIEKRGPMPPYPLPPLRIGELLALLLVLLGLIARLGDHYFVPLQSDGRGFFRRSEYVHLGSLLRVEVSERFQTIPGLQPTHTLQRVRRPHERPHRTMTFVGRLARQRIPDGSRSFHRSTLSVRTHFLRRLEIPFSLLAPRASRLCRSSSRVYKKLPAPKIDSR